MQSFISRRAVLTSLGGISAVAVLAGCSDSDAQGSSSGAAAAEAPAAEGTVDVAKLMEVPEGSLPDLAYGKDDAPVTVVEYASLTCSHCAAFHRDTWPTVKEKYVDSGKVRFIIREFPFDPLATAGFMVARCSESNRNALVDTLFDKQADWVVSQGASEKLLGIARLAGISQEKFNACLTDQALAGQVQAVQQRGQSEFGVNATPTFFINGNKYSGALSVDQMSAIIDSML
ncbi:DsbA family protein [Limoniibacter endophyticus]|uniref:Disulfide bond formation protein DsbD n=1 Tax=Limoniibacter endophyticus TaxID=1565040 RepID=A0A8J3DIL6_9HYPH|nr:DsbA family protein [Limoniibacter endophyticus]GHC71618.1 disulfide bond formation protein DsbD [Limoniibacter endophyticus]